MLFVFILTNQLKKKGGRNMYVTLFVCLLSVRVDKSLFHVTNCRDANT
jgi:hypothetical protein